MRVRYKASTIASTTYQERAPDNEADYNSRHPKPPADKVTKNRSERSKFELREIEGEFEEDVLAVVKLAVPEGVTWQTLQEESQMDPEMTGLNGDDCDRLFHVGGKKQSGASIRRGFH